MLCGRTYLFPRLSENPRALEYSEKVAPLYPLGSMRAAAEGRAAASVHPWQLGDCGPAMVPPCTQASHVQSEAQVRPASGGCEEWNLGHPAGRPDTALGALPPSTPRHPRSAEQPHGMGSSLWSRCERDPDQTMSSFCFSLSPTQVSLGLLHAHATHILWPPGRWQRLQSVLPPERLPVQSEDQ